MSLIRSLFNTCAQTSLESKDQIVHKFVNTKINLTNAPKSLG